MTHLQRAKSSSQVILRYQPVANLARYQPTTNPFTNSLPTPDRPSPTHTNPHRHNTNTNTTHYQLITNNANATHYHPILARGSCFSTAREKHGESRPARRRRRPCTSQLRPARPSSPRTLLALCHHDDRPSPNLIHAVPQARPTYQPNDHYTIDADSS